MNSTAEHDPAEPAPTPRREWQAPDLVRLSADATAASDGSLSDAAGSS